MDQTIPSLNDIYCNGCRNCVISIESNCYEYLWLYPTPYPVGESMANYYKKKCDPCMCFCTVLCCGPKSICLIPGCPFFVFCPSCICKKN
jgi:hypothetical protein